MALTDNLVSVWKLEGNGNDSHGTHHATANASIFYVAGKDGQGAQQSDTDTSSGFLVGDNIADFTTGYPYSVAAWFSTTFNSIQQNANMIIFTTAATSYPWYTHCLLDMLMDGTENGKVRLFIRDTSGVTRVLKSVAAYNDGNWHHAVGVVESNGNMKLYIDGSLVASNADTGYTLPTAQRTTLLTNWDQAAAGQYVGVADEIYYWTRALTAQEVSDLYNNGNGLFYDPSSGTFKAPGSGIITSRRLLIQL